MLLRNVIAAKGSMSLNLQRIAFQEQRQPRNQIKRLVSELGITLPERGGRMVNKYRTEISYEDIALLDLVLSALGLDISLGVQIIEERAGFEKAMEDFLVQVRAAVGVQKEDPISVWRDGEDGQMICSIAFPKKAAGLAARSGFLAQIGLSAEAVRLQSDLDSDANNNKYLDGYY